MSLNFSEWYIVLGVTVAVIVILIFAMLAMVKAFYIKVPQGTALIINDTTSQPKVKFTGGLVLPVIHKKEFMQISLITLEIDRRGKEGLICKDNMRADITVAFYLRVNETQDDVLKVAGEAAKKLAEQGYRTSLVLHMDIRPGFTGQLTEKPKIVDAILSGRSE